MTEMIHLHSVFETSDHWIMTLIVCFLYLLFQYVHVSARILYSVGILYFI